MCRLFGVLSQNPVNAAYYLQEAPQSLYVQSRIDKKRLQGDGWGIGWFHSGKPEVVKSANALYRDLSRIRKAVKRPRGNVLVGHVRWASNPLKLSRPQLIGPAHTQPFRHKSWLFAHNGTLYIPREVKAELGSLAKYIKGNNDSEVLFYWLLSHLLLPLREKAGMRGPLTRTLSLKGRGYFKKAIRASMQGLDKIWNGCKTRYPIYKHPYHGLNWVLTNGRSLFAFCYVNKRGFNPSKALCHSTQPYFQLQAKITDDEVAVASEPMADEPGWRPFRHGQLLIAHKNGRKISSQFLKVI